MYHNGLMTRLGAVIASIALLAAGCGDDDDSAGADLEGAGVDLDGYCDASLAIELLPEPDIDFETASPEEIGAAIQAFMAEEMRPLVDAAEPLVPDEIRGSVTELISTLDSLEASGDVSLLETPAFGQATAEIHEFDLQQCGWTQASLTAVDFGFDGSLPSAAGVTSLDLTNDGAEHHVAVLGRTKDGIDASAADAFAGVESEEQFDEVFDLVTSISIPPGGSDYAVVDLEPGEYVLFCPIPVGTVGDSEGDGPPHFTQGMVETFAIE